MWWGLVGCFEPKNAGLSLFESFLGVLLFLWWWLFFCLFRVLFCLVLLWFVGLVLVFWLVGFSGVRGGWFVVFVCCLIVCGFLVLWVVFVFLFACCLFSLFCVVWLMVGGLWWWC